jgi:hypothetical protein
MEIISLNELHRQNLQENDIYTLQAQTQNVNFVETGFNESDGFNCYSVVDNQQWPTEQN